MLCLLQGKPESCWRLNVRGVTQVFDVGPWDRTEPLKVHVRVVVTRCLLPVEKSVLVVGGFFGSVVVLFMDGKHHLHDCGGAEQAVTETDDRLDRFIVCGKFGVYFVVCADATCDAQGVYVGSLCVAVGPLLQARFSGRELLTAHVHEAHLRLMDWDWIWVLTAHLRHLPPMRRRGAALSWLTGCGVVGSDGMSTSSTRLIG